jgi:hypothetical protein
MASGAMGGLKAGPNCSVFKAPLTAGRELPPQLPGFPIDSVELAVVTGEVDKPARDGRRRWHRSRGCELPELASGRGIDRVHILVVATDVDNAFMPYGR